MTNKESFVIEKDTRVLKFKTRSFSAERGSILHSGIYSRELAASLGAGAMALIASVIVRPRDVVSGALLAVAVFIAAFVLLRTFMFVEPELEAVFDKKDGTITISVKGIFKKNIAYSLSGLKAIGVGKRIITPENPDGVSVVEKIALQHGTVIPGFGETKEFNTVELNFDKGESVIIYSTDSSAMAQEAAGRLREFLYA